MKLIKSRMVILIAVMTMFFSIFIFLTGDNTTRVFRLDEIEMEQETVYILEDGGYVDVILAGLSILVTAILGYVTYVQTKEAMRLDSIDKTPYFLISNFLSYQQINAEKYHIGSAQYGYTPRLRFVECDAGDTALVFKILLENVTENNISKANVYYSEDKINSYKQLKKLPISERLNKVVKNANKHIELLKIQGLDVTEIVDTRDETERIIKALKQTPETFNCKKEDDFEIELVTYLDGPTDVTKYLNQFCALNYHVVIDMETIHGYRYTQVVYLELSYANIYSKDDSPMKLMFTVQDFDSKIIPVEWKKVNWEEDFYNRETKSLVNKIKNWFRFLSKH